MATAIKKRKVKEGLGDVSRKNIRTNVWGTASYLVDISGLDEAAETADPDKDKNYKAVATILLNAQRELKALKQ
ncbi:MAG: hypothetical protein WEA58_04130 [Balneolaceae bacterium]